MLDDFDPIIHPEITYTYPKHKHPKHGKSKIKTKHQPVKLGNKIAPPKVQSPPSFSIHTLNSSSSSISWLAPTATLAENVTYTLVLTDPDATSRADPAKSEMCHWIATNISLPLSISVSVSSEDGSMSVGASGHVDELVSYLPPSPPPKTGKHRYVFVLLAGLEESAPKLKAPEERAHWGYGKVRHGVRDWARDNGLVPVGEFGPSFLRYACLARESSGEL